MPLGDPQIAERRRAGDPFAADRAATGARMGRFHGEELLMLLRWKAVRAAARDPKRFDSGERGRVPIPPEDAIRPFRQIPIETTPPEHALWKEIVLPFFRRPTDPAVRPEFEDVLRGRLGAAIGAGPVEAVQGLALPIQSAALAVLLDCDRTIAAEWQGWGLHAFRTDGATDPAKAARFLDFIDRMLDRGAGDPGMGLFHALHGATFQDRPLTRDEMRGICHLALAGGRDTVVNALTGTLAHLAETPADLERLRADPALVPLAAEEMFRVLSPLPMIGRVCPEGHAVGPHAVAPGGRAALCWAAANRDPDMFDAPGEIRLDRRPNPHVAFGAGDHTCLGAPMARLLLRTLLAELAASVARIEVIEAVPRTTPFGTPHLYERLMLVLHPA